MSRGGRPVAVPDVTKQRVDAAEHTLLTDGFRVATGAAVYGTATPDTVVEVRAPGGGELGATEPAGSILTLDVAAGPLPELTGLTLAKATSTLAVLGVRLEKSGSAYDDDGTTKPGQVLKTETPKGGVRAGGTVKIVLSKGPRTVVVPTVIGDTWAEASQALNSAGLSPITQQTPGASDQVTGTVPAAGETAPIGDTVTVDFGTSS